MKRKAFTILLLCALTISITACAGGKKASEPALSTDTNEPVITEETATVQETTTIEETTTIKETTFADLSLIHI